MTIPNWSYSRLGIYEKCNLWAKIAFIDKIPEPERPLPPGKTEHANDRGSRIHSEAEMYTTGQGPFTPALKHFEAEFNSLKILAEQKMAHFEGNWGMDREWGETSWTGRDTWLRLKLDAMVFLDKHNGVVIDYKTGKRWGKEIAHNEQCQLYALIAFLRFPDLEYVTTELWYLDLNELATQTYTRAQALRFKASWNRRAEKMTTAIEFPANPNIFSCKYCAYGPDGTGHCQRGVRK